MTASRRLLALSAAALAAFLLVYLIAVRTELGQRADEAALAGGRAAPEAAQDAANSLLQLVSIGSLVAAIVILSSLAWLRRRPGLLLIPVAVIGLSLLATELFKLVILPRPELVPDSKRAGNTYPSGHATVAAAIGFAALLIAPPRLRPAMGFGAAGLAAAGGLLVVTADWHRPSDSIGSYLLTLAVAAASMAALHAWRPAATTRGHAAVATSGLAGRLELAAALAGLALFLGAGLFASLRYGPDVDWNRLHAAYLLASAAIVVVAGVIVAALLRGLDERRAEAGASSLG